MPRKPPTPVRYRQPYRYASPDIPLAAIRRFVRQIAARFQPEKIILFGSYAYGTPHAESDVDLMVIMPAHDVVALSIRIGLALERPFSVDIHVRTPKQIERGLREDDWDWFLREVMEKGKVLYEAPLNSRHPSPKRKRGGRTTKNAAPALALGAGISAEQRAVTASPARRARR
jgi:predicted nucleotidyltransferase